jgi:hypothetical protein
MMKPVFVCTWISVLIVGLESQLGEFFNNYTGKLKKIANASGKERESMKKLKMLPETLM